MKNNAPLIFLFIIVAIMVLLIIDVHAQQPVYSSIASMEVRKTVENDSAKIQYDTITMNTMPPFVQGIRNIFSYKKFQVVIMRDRNSNKFDTRVYSGNMQVMLKPDDEYAIMEKLITLIR